MFYIVWSQMISSKWYSYPNKCFNNSTFIWSALRRYTNICPELRSCEIYTKAWFWIEQFVLFLCCCFFSVIITRVRTGEDPPYRPRVVEDESEAPERLVLLMKYCWQESPEARPDMHSVIKMLIDINGKRYTCV